MKINNLTTKAILIFFILFSQIIFGQNISWQQTNGPFGGYVKSIAISPNGLIFAVAGSRLFVSSNNGNNWSITSLTLNYMPYLLINKDGDIFVADGVYIHKSIDNGNSWTTIQIANSDQIYCLSKNSNDHLFAAVGKNIFYSTDEGENWESNEGSLPVTNIIGISTSLDSCYFITTDKGIYKSIDNGITYTNTTNNLSEKPYYCAVTTKNKKVIVSAQGAIYSSSNLGLTWSQSSLSSQSYFLNIVIDSSGNIWTTDGSSLLKSTNEGDTWEVVRTLSYDNSILQFTANSNIVAVNGNIYAGANNGVLLFTNNGQDVENLNRGLIATNTNGISATKGGEVFVCGEIDVFVTTDKGDTWNPTNAKSVFNYFTSGSLVTDTDGYIYCADDAGICISKNKGKTWSRKFLNGTTEDIVSIAIGQNGKLFAVTPHKIYRSINKGNTWQSVKDFSAYSWNSRIAVSKNGYVLHTRNDGIYRSIDNGNNWFDVSPIGNSNFREIVISYKGYIIVSSGNSVFISKDNGDNWNKLNINQTSGYDVTSLYEASNGYLYANVGSVFYFSANDGTSWNFIDYPFDRGFDITYMTEDIDGYLYSGSYSKGVFRTVTPILKILPPEVNASPRDQKAYLSWNKNSSSNFLRYKIYGNYNHYPTTIIDSTIGGVEDTTKIIQGLINDQLYFIVVSAVDNQGNESFSEEISVTPIPVPVVPMLSSPINNSLNVSPSCILKWQKNNRAEKYTIQVSGDSTFNDLVVTDSLVTDTLYHLGLLVYDTKYFWRVKAKNIAGESNWSEVWEFKTVIASPNTPYLTQPNNNSVNQPISILFKWQRLSDADKYHIQISSLQNFSNLTVNDTSVVDTFKQVSNLNNNTSYYWKIRARNVGGYSPWSEIWNFKTIVALPNVPTLVSPGNGNKNQPIDLKLTWNSVQDAETYHIQLSQDTLFINGIVDDSTITVPSKDIKSLNTGMKYYWKVNAKNYAGRSKYSSMWNFTTILPLPDSLKALSTELRKVKLTWIDNIDNELGFVLERKTLEEAGYKLIDTVKANITSYIDSTVSIATTYKYRIKAYTLYATSSYSNEAQVTTLTGVDEQERVPIEYKLTQNYPNPFNPATTIKYSIPIDGFVKLRIYDILGKEILTLINKEQNKGNYEAKLDGSKLSSGVYIYRIESGSFIKSRMMILQK